MNGSRDLPFIWVPVLYCRYTQIHTGSQSFWHLQVPHGEKFWHPQDATPQGFCAPPTYLSYYSLKCSMWRVSEGPLLLPLLSKCVCWPFIAHGVRYSTFVYTHLLYYYFSLQVRSSIKKKKSTILSQHQQSLISLLPSSFLLFSHSFSVSFPDSRCHKSAKGRRRSCEPTPPPPFRATVATQHDASAL